MDTVYTLEKNELPFLLQQITDPPKKLYIKGKMPGEDTVILCVVGARQYSSYGEEACRKLILGLKGQNICIVSGLAIGIDAVAHKAALEAGLMTIAFPGSGLDEKILYPERNRKLADEILYAGGALLSEFEMSQEGTPWTFPQRNRLMAGISKATLVIEAELMSGTLITSRLATEYNREVGAVPGQIFSKLSEGPHMLIRLGATPITCSDDILEMLGLKTNKELGQINQTKDSNTNLNSNGTYADKNIKNSKITKNSKANKNLNDSKVKISKFQLSLLPSLSENERKIMELLEIETQTNEQLVIKSGLQAREINAILSSFEIQDLIEKGMNGSIKIK